MKVLISFFFAFCLFGCGSGYPTFYTLSAEGPSPSGGGLSIGVGPVILAEYVDRQNLVVQTGPNKVEVAEGHRWAGDLDNSIARVISINLGRRLNTGNVRTYPWLRDSEIDYQVAMDIREFVAGDDGFVRIESSWRIYSLPSRGLKASGTFTAREPIESETFESMVAAQSRLLARLSEKLAGEIR
ncbi:MAG: membrane integrity-associated transporter subunit PqiC [Akkermansiaceae bacterium]